MPSYALATASTNIIVNLNTTGELVFPIDVKYNFHLDEWIDGQDAALPVEMPWTQAHDEVYPWMNDIILIKSGVQKVVGNTVLYSNYILDSSTRCEKQPERWNCEHRFYCIDRQFLHRSELKPPMKLENAMAECARTGWFIEPRLPSHPHQNESIILWTGILRFNESHFQRQDGAIFKPSGFSGTFRDFPDTVHLHITRLGVVTVHNSLGDAFNKVDSDYCLCFLNASGSVWQLVKHQNFIYVALLVLASLSLALYLMLTQSA